MAGGRRFLLGAVGVPLAAAILAIGFALFYAFPSPTLSLTLDRPAIGPRTVLRAVVRQEWGGVARATLTLEQGGRSMEVDRFESEVPAWQLWGGIGEVTLKGRAGKSSLPWLREGEVVLRLEARPRAGLLRRPEPSLLERHVPVRLRPPEVRLLSEVPAARPGGSGMVAYRVDPQVIESGLAVAGTRLRSHPAPDGREGERFVLFALPQDLAAHGPVVLYAEDDAGNRAELPLFETWEEPEDRSDSIDLDDAFLERALPPIVARTPGIELPEEPLARYLWINRELRRQNRDAVAEIAGKSAPAFLWRGPFLGLARSVTTGRFGDRRSYSYQGEGVDQQTHLGLDLASVSHAPVVAPNGGKVAFAGFLGIYGNVVIIDHGFGLTSLLGHLSRITVEAGQWVARGQEIGRTGSTGLAGGDHLHLGIFVEGIAVDPEPWLDPTWVGSSLHDVLSLLLDPESLATAPEASARAPAASRTVQRSH